MWDERIEFESGVGSRLGVRRLTQRVGRETGFTAAAGRAMECAARQSEQCMSTDVALR